MTRRGLLKNPLLNLLFFNGLAGVVAAAVVTVGLLAIDLGGLGSLVMGSDNPVLPAALLFISLTITLASVAMGVAVMRLPSDAGGQDGGKRIAIAPVEKSNGLGARKPVPASIRLR